MPASDSRLRVPLVDHVLVDERRSANLFEEFASAAPAPLSRTTRIGQVVTTPQHVREQLLVDLRAGLDEVAVGCG